MLYGFQFMATAFSRKVKDIEIILQQISTGVENYNEDHILQYHNRI